MSESLLSNPKAYLKAEVIKSEKKRLDVFIGFLLMTTLMALVLQFAHAELLKDTFKNPFSYPLIMVFSIVMVLMFVIGRKWVLRVQRTKEKLTRKYYWYSILMEIFFPSFWLVLASSIEETAALLDSPVVFIYFILIIVSSLHLEFWVSAVMGLLIAIFFAGFTYWVTHAYPTPFGLPTLTYYLKSFMFLMSGIVAGAVANELKLRLLKTYAQIKSKEEIEGLFNQQVSKEMAEVLKVKKDYSARLEVTILFLDIRDFTQKVQHLTPEEVNKFQNDFFAPVIEIINDSKGIVNQIMGDGLMATFGAPVSDKTHYNCAWMAVNRIQQFMEMSRIHNPIFKDLEVGMGLHCGEVLIGNIGTESRRQLSVSGTPVIIASRIEQLNKEMGSSVLISKVLYDLLKDRVSEYKSKGKIKMKGLDEEIEVIEIF
ncbi:MAG: adenylate/guanylate cyclase domain-containing protein [Marinoscillum sp.]